MKDHYDLKFHSYEGVIKGPFATYVYLGFFEGLQCF